MRTEGDTSGRLNAKEIADALGLEPHPEGGFYRETYRSDEVLAADLDERYGGGERHCGTAIYYMVTPDSMSALHRVKTDEVFHFYLGDPVEQALISPGGKVEVARLGSDILAGELPQRVVRRGWWQGARLADGGRFALLGATVSPGFDFTDFEMGDRDVLLAELPHAAEVVKRFTLATDSARR